MRSCSESKRTPQIVWSIVVSPCCIMCLLTSGYCAQVAETPSRTTPHAYYATVLMQVLGGTRTPNHVATRAELPRTGNSAPQSQPIIYLTWKASNSAGVKYYNVYRSGTQGDCLKAKSDTCKKINPSPVTTTSYTDSAVQVGQSYFYVVKAVSSGGTESSPSNEAPVVVSSPKA
jgi:hypothetical protein